MVEKSLLIANRYSKALVDLAKSGEITNEIILNQLLFVQEVINSSKDLIAVLEMPQVSIDIKLEIINRVFEKHLHKLIINFLKLLVEQNRFSEFNEIVTAYKEDLDKINNINRIQVVSAVELNEIQKQQIKTIMEDKLRCTVLTEWEIEPDILAGLVFKYDGNVIDTSLRNKLKELNRNIVRI